MGRKKPCSFLIGNDKRPCGNSGTISCSRCEMAAKQCNKPELIHFFCRSCYEVSNCKICDSILEASQNEDAQQQVVKKSSDNTIKQIDFETLPPMTVEPTGNTNELNEVHTSALNVLCDLWYTAKKRVLRSKAFWIRYPGADFGKKSSALWIPGYRVELNDYSLVYNFMQPNLPQPEHGEAIFELFCAPVGLLNSIYPRAKVAKTSSHNFNKNSNKSKKRLKDNRNFLICIDSVDWIQPMIQSSDAGKFQQMEQILKMKYGPTAGSALSAKISDAALERIIEPVGAVSEALQRATVSEERAASSPYSLSYSEPSSPVKDITTQEEYDREYGLEGTEYITTRPQDGPNDDRTTLAANDWVAYYHPIFVNNVIVTKIFAIPSSDHGKIRFGSDHPGSVSLVEKLFGDWTKKRLKRPITKFRSLNSYKLIVQTEAEIKESESAELAAIQRERQQDDFESELVTPQSADQANVDPTRNTTISAGNEEGDDRVIPPNVDPTRNDGTNHERALVEQSHTSALNEIAAAEEKAEIEIQGESHAKVTDGFGNQDKVIIEQPVPVTLISANVVNNMESPKTADNRLIVDLSVEGSEDAGRLETVNAFGAVKRTLESSDSIEDGSDLDHSYNSSSPFEFMETDSYDNCHCNSHHAVDEETYENDKFEWTEPCATINDTLPPSFLGSFLYVRNKTAQKDTLYFPGVVIFNNPPKDKREPEIYLCAVKCAKANSLNFLYSKVADVEALFQDGAGEKDMCISIDVRLNPPDNIGTILPCLREDGNEEVDTKKLQRLLDKAAYSLKLWTTISFISKAEFLAHKPLQMDNQLSKTKRIERSSTSNAQATTAKVSHDIGSRYNARASTMVQRNEQKQKVVNSNSKESVNEKAAKNLAKLKGEIQTLKQINQNLKSKRKVEVDAAVAKAASKITNKFDLLTTELETTTKNLSKANNKISDLSAENSELVKAKNKLVNDSKLATPGSQKLGGNIIAASAIAETKPASGTPKNIADEYKAFASIVRDTDAAIEIGKIQAEGSIVLAKMEEDQKRQIKAVDDAIILQSKRNALDLLNTPEQRKRSRSSSSGSCVVL